MAETLLQVKELNVAFRTAGGNRNAVERLSFELRDGEILGIVGESGSGKSVASLAVMGLLPAASVMVSGSIRLRGEELLGKTERQLRHIRGKRISMIFQDPLTSLNPAYTIGNQLIETIRLHRSMNKKAAVERAIELLTLVGITLPERRMRQYPYELSGGMRQRVMIALALSSGPEVLIADEPTTALDVTIQAGIVDLLLELRERLGMSIILISHDLGVVSRIADSVMVLYAGRAVERSEADKIFKQPHHPYTQGLLASLPSVSVKRDRLEAIPGAVPDPEELPQGCKFSTRCPYARPLCEEREPTFETAPDGTGSVRCWIHTKEWENDG